MAGLSKSGASAVCAIGKSGPVESSGETAGDPDAVLGQSPRGSVGNQRGRVPTRQKGVQLCLLFPEQVEQCPAAKQKGEGD